MTNYRWGNFYGSAVAAIYQPAAGEVDRTDPADPSNAPAIDPTNNLSMLKWHSDFFQYQLEHYGVSTVSHALVAGATTTLVALHSWTQLRLGQTVTADHTLYTHGLGYVPQFMVAYAGANLQPGTNVQALSDRGRHVCAYATSTIIGLYEVGNSSDVDLPAVSIDYEVFVFSTPAAVALAPLFKMDFATGIVTMANDKVSSAKQYARRVQPSESSFDINLDDTGDVGNGGVKIVSGGNEYSDYYYVPQSGNFTGPAYVPIGGVI